MARTGSGKTAAFLVPMLEKLKSHSSVVCVCARVCIVICVVMLSTYHRQGLEH